MRSRSLITETDTQRLFPSHYSLKRNGNVLIKTDYRKTNNKKKNKKHFKIIYYELYIFKLYIIKM